VAADFKSHVLMRDEKGLMGIAFKRLLLAGVSGGFTYTLLRLGAPHWAMLGGIIFGIVVLFMTATRGGLPLWQRLLFHVRGSLLLAAVNAPQSTFAQVATALELPVELAHLDAAQVFAEAKTDFVIDMREWVTFAHPWDADQDDGLIFVDAPLEHGGGEQ
jgi:hypothetical protein